jgi:protein-tyrosine phosphatase
VTPLRVVFVCTGNRFRSPLAEGVLRSRLGDLEADVQIESFGTLELGAVAALPEAVAEARRLGVDISEHRARSLANVDLSEVDLVLGFERMHVVTAVVDAHSDRDRTFTLPELVAAVNGFPGGPDEAPVERARRLVASAAGLRRPNAQLLDVSELTDPLGRPPEEQARIADEVASLVDQLARSLLGVER